jgi:AraC-like DNA-binding protein
MLSENAGHRKSAEAGIRMTFFAPALGALWRQLEGYGIDPEPLFREHGVAPNVIFDQGARVPNERSLRLSARAAELAGDPRFGLRSSDYFRPAHLGALGFAWLASSSLRTAFERLNRYVRMIQEGLTIDLQEDDRYFYVRIEDQFDTPDEALHEDTRMATLVKFCRIIAGMQFNPARACFRQQEPRETGYYFELFRCPLEFGAPDTMLALHLADVDKRLTGSSDQLAELNEHIVVKYLAHSAKKDIVNRAKAAIIDGLAEGGISEKSIAEDLHMTPRNLHRKLQKENTSFKLLLTEVRRELAQQYIQDRSKTLTEISYMLGFSEASSFSRAYKGWTGQAPSEARQDVA